MHRTRPSVGVRRIPNLRAAVVSAAVDRTLYQPARWRAAVSPPSRPAAYGLAPVVEVFGVPGPNIIVVADNNEDVAARRRGERRLEILMTVIVALERRTIEWHTI
jgi:hypothetical protein